MIPKPTKYKGVPNQPKTHVRAKGNEADALRVDGATFSKSPKIGMEGLFKKNKAAQFNA
jgi:hypothetical protein